MNLAELIDTLERYPSEQEVRHGLGNPHSYRGYYEQLAFEPIRDTSVGQMLDAANSCVGRSFAGWKGGDFVMTPDTQVWLSRRGGVVEAPLSCYQLAWMLGDEVRGRG